MTNEAFTIQPDYEVRVYKGDVEVALAGLFIADDNTVDVGMGMDGDEDKEVISVILAVSAEAFRGLGNWYDIDALRNHPQIKDKIKKGERS